MDKKKKLAVAVAAVMNYIYEESLECAAQSMVPKPAATPLPKVLPNAWGASGRQDAMQLRQLMQFRTFKTTRF
ncbi:hypothetical protein MHK_001263 [Candidatus Magnetomorum sp. HK-1]|nr:hypothetical protein MHK_001263 [Candidatus Magnetomorum sp. HK-1]